MKIDRTGVHLDPLDIVKTLTIFFFILLFSMYEAREDGWADCANHYYSVRK